MKTHVFLTLAFLWLPCFGKAQDYRQKEKAARNPFEGRPEAIEVGQKLFAAACSGCHGTHADGGRGPNLADGRLVRLKNDQRLFGAIRNGVPGADMPPFNLPDGQIWQLLAYIRSLSTPAAESQVPGDPEAGKEIFFGNGSCATCHMILGRGGFLGPDLSNIGMSRSWKQLRQAFLDPKNRSRAGYKGVIVVTTAGLQIVGIVKNNTNYSLDVQDAAGNLHLLSMRDVRELIYRKDSLMPDDYNRRLTPKEIDDVLAYLSRRSVRPIREQPSPADHSRNPK